MPKIKNVSGEDRTVPSLGGRLVLANQVVEVPAEDVYSFTCQTVNWEPVDKAATTAHNDAAKTETPEG